MHNIHSKTENISPIDLGIFHHIDINLYPLFVAIYEQKSISKAAQILCISQSAASHALQRLRQHLQDDLFIRSGSKMRATPFAEQIYPIIQHALFSIQNISKQNQKFDPKQIHSLKIAIHDEIEPIIFPKLVEHFQSINLDIQFFSIRLDRKTVVSDLASQQIDFVIDLEQNFGDKVLFQPLLNDKFVVCTAAKEMSKDIYLSAQHLGVSSRRAGILFEDIFLNQKKLSRQILLRCQHYSTALQILEQKPKSVLTIPQSILSHLQIAPSLHIFETPVDLPYLTMGMFWHSAMESNSRLQFLKTEIEKIFA